MEIEIKDLCLVALIGASGSGKSTFAKRRFQDTEVFSSDHYRAVLSDDEGNQEVSQAAFETLFHIADRRLTHGRLIVIDATSATAQARAQIIRLARKQQVAAIAIVLDMPLEVCLSNNAKRPGRHVPEDIIRVQVADVHKSIRNLRKEGFEAVHVLQTPQEAEAAQVVRVCRPMDFRTEHGPFDIIGDVHGCYSELTSLLRKQGYIVDETAATALPQEGRKAVFVGDLCDRGPDSMDVLRLVMNMAKAGHAMAVLGNHDEKLHRKLRGANVQLTHGLDITVRQMEREGPKFARRVQEFLGARPTHLLLDDGRLVIAHAGIPERYQGREGERVRSFCLYGDVSGEVDGQGFPIRKDWAAAYHGKAEVVYGHMAQAEVRPKSNTVCIDTGCVYGGKLTAYRYPEKQIVQVDALRVYSERVRPLP